MITPEERAEWRRQAECGADAVKIICGSCLILLTATDTLRLLDALEQAEAERDAMWKQMNDLMCDSRGVDGLHLNGDVAEWDWLSENEWLSLWSNEEAERRRGK